MIFLCLSNEPTLTVTNSQARCTVLGVTAVLTLRYQLLHARISSALFHPEGGKTDVHTTMFADLDGVIGYL
jgi:hypothetical protein